MAKKKEKKNKLLPVILSGVCLVIVLVIGCVLLLNFTGPRRKAINYIDGSFGYNERKVCKSMHKQIYKASDIEIDECYDYMEKMFEYYEEHDIDFEDISYKITDKKKLSKDDVEEIEESIQDEYDDFPKISKIIRYRVKLTYDGDEETKKTTYYVFVAKIKGSWGVIGANNSKKFSFGPNAGEE